MNIPLHISWNLHRHVIGIRHRARGTYNLLTYIYSTCTRLQAGSCWRRWCGSHICPIAEPQIQLILHWADLFNLTCSTGVVPLGNMVQKKVLDTWRCSPPLPTLLRVLSTPMIDTCVRPGKKMMVCIVGVRGQSPRWCFLVTFSLHLESAKIPPPPWDFGPARTLHIVTLCWFSLEQCSL